MGAIWQIEYMKAVLRFIKIATSVFLIIAGVFFLIISFPIYDDMIWQVLYFFDFSTNLPDVVKLVGITLFPLVSICAFGLLVMRLITRRRLRVLVIAFFLSSALFYTSLLISDLPSRYNLEFNLSALNPWTRSALVEDQIEDREYTVSIFESPYTDHTKSIMIRIATTESYGCSPSSIDSAIEQSGNTIVVTIDGDISQPTGGCFWSMEPATATYGMSADEGLYALVLRKSENEDRYAFRVSTDEINITDISTEFSRLALVDTRVLRYPIGSITVRCMRDLEKPNANSEPTCDEFYTHLRNLGAVKSMKQYSRVLNTFEELYDYDGDAERLKELVESYWRYHSIFVLISTRGGESYNSDDYWMRERKKNEERAAIRGDRPVKCVPPDIVSTDEIPRDRLDKLSEYLKSHNLVPLDSSLSDIFDIGNAVDTYKIQINVGEGKAEYWASKIKEDNPWIDLPVWALSSSCD